MLYILRSRTIIAMTSVNIRGHTLLHYLPHFSGGYIIAANLLFCYLVDGLIKLLLQRSGTLLLFLSEWFLTTLTLTRLTVLTLTLTLTVLTLTLTVLLTLLLAILLLIGRNYKALHFLSKGQALI